MDGCVERPDGKTSRLFRESHASIGVGAMIIFISIILVTSIISALIIQTAYRLSSKPKEMVEDRSNSKIIIDTIFVYRFEPCWQSLSTDPDCVHDWGHHQLAMQFQLAGNEDIPDTSVSYFIACPETEDVVSPFRGSTFDHSTVSHRAFGAFVSGTRNLPFELGAAVYSDLIFEPDASGARANILTPGVSYSIMIDMYDNKNNFGNDNEGCRISLDYDVSLLIAIDGGHVTYDVINCQSYDMNTRCN